MKKKEQETLNRVNVLLKTDYKTLDWSWISEKHKLSESFIREFRNHVDWKVVSFKYILSESFIREFEDKVDWIGVSSHIGLSEDFIREYKHKIDFDSDWNKYDYPW